MKKIVIGVAGLMTVLLLTVVFAQSQENHPQGTPQVKRPVEAMPRPPMMSPAHEEMFKRQQQKIDDMKVIVDRLDKSSAAMSAAQGDEKIKAMEAVITELINQRKQELQKNIDDLERMMERMRNMRGMGGMGGPREMGVPGMVPGAKAPVKPAPPKENK